MTDEELIERYGLQNIKAVSRILKGGAEITSEVKTRSDYEVKRKTH